MTTLFDIPATLAQQTAPVAMVDKPSDAVVLSICAMGLCVLVVWIVGRLIRGRKFMLRDAPGRPNQLGWLHVAIILAWTFGGKLLALLGDPPDPDAAITTDALTRMLVETLTILAISLVVAHIGFRHGIVRGLGLTARRWFTDASRGVFGILAVYPICVGLFMLSAWLVPENLKAEHDLLELLRVGDVTAIQKLLAVGLAFLVAPIVEEVLYRGLLQTALRRVLGGPWRGIIVSSVLFAAVHLTIVRDPASVVGVQALAPLFALSVVLGYSYERTGRLGASILIHMLFNGINLLCTLLDAG